MKPLPWNRLTREEKALEIAWGVWLFLVFFGALLLWLIVWIAS